MSKTGGFLAARFCPLQQHFLQPRSAHSKRRALRSIRSIHPATQSPCGSGLASYTFRNFTRAQLIGFMQQLNVRSLNAKDVKDHLPMDPQEEAAALADYAAAGIKSARCRSHLFH